MELDAQTARRLKDYLSNHEDDIAQNRDDFGDLNEVFKQVFFRRAQKEEKEDYCRAS